MIKNKCIEEGYLHCFWISSIHSIVQLLLFNFLVLMVIIIIGRVNNQPSYILQGVKNFILLIAREAEEIHITVMILQLM